MRGAATLAHDLGLTPNLVTIIGFFLSILSSFLYILSKFDYMLISVAASVFLLSGFCDILDGSLAILYSEETIFGGFLDSLMDRYSDSFVICGIIVGGLCDLRWGLLALIGSILVSYARARAEVEKIRMISVGLAERAERILIICVASFFTFVNRGALAYGIVLLALLTNFTVLQRMLYVYKVTSLKKGKKG
jgi:archaetidylinositol phosphate synthase